MKTFTLMFLLVFAMPVYALDSDTEQRCKEIDAMGGANACRCSEPLITQDSMSGNSWNPSGSVSKQCGPSGTAISKNGGPANGDGFVPLAGQFTAPGGVPYGYKDAHVNGANGAILGSVADVPTNVGRVCHRAVFRLSSDFTGNGGTCQSVKVIEMNPSPFGLGNQFQGGFSGGSNVSFDIYFTGGARDRTTANGIEQAHFSNNDSNGSYWNTQSNLRGSTCKNNWCGIEQCWYGDYSTGRINPIARTYVLSPATGAVVSDAVLEYVRGQNGAGGPAATSQSFDVPVNFGTNWIANMYRANNGSPGCQGSRVYLYAMEAAFATADDGSPQRGPWIGPPKEFTGGGSTEPPVPLGAPGTPRLLQ